jgi:hypothetical protein
MINETAKNKKVSRDVKDQVISLLPFFLSSSIFNTFKDKFLNSQTLFNHNFLIKIIQLVCFELQGMRVSQVFVETTFIKYFRNFHVMDIDK